eukprot:12904139-Prorocentrum_lima.AAC.1
MLRTWRTAQQRGQEVGIPALGGNERFTLLMKMISKLEMKHSQFSHRVTAVKYSREARIPSLETARHLEEVIMEELRMLEADKKAG